MCRSVPQMDAMATRIRTSSGRGSGTGTWATSVAIGTGLRFTAAFIVEVIRGPPPRRVRSEAISTFYGVQFRRSVPDENEEVLLLPERAVESIVSRVDPEDGRRVELSRRRDDEHVLHPDPLEDLRAEMQVPAAQDESLRSDRADDELRARMALEVGEDSSLVEILAEDPAAEEGVDPEEGLLESEALRDRLCRRSGTEQEQGVRLRPQE